MSSLKIDEVSKPETLSIEPPVIVSSFGPEAVLRERIDADTFSEYNFSDNFESSKNDTFILFNPKIAYNNTLNSIRLISLLNQLEYCLINDINVIIISTKEHNLDDMFSINNIKKLAKKEIKDRHNYGPNINKKVYYFSTNYKFNNEKNNEIVLGPKISDNLYEYEIRLFLSNNTNYNEIMSLFSEVEKFNPIKVRNI